MKLWTQSLLGAAFAAMLFTTASAQTANPAPDPFRAAKPAIPKAAPADPFSSGSGSGSGGGSGTAGGGIGGGEGGGSLPASVPQPPPAPVCRLIHCQWEVYSMELSEAQKLLADFRSDSQRYAEIEQRVGRGSAKLEEMITVRTRSGQRAKVEGIAEKIYPTQFAIGTQKPAGAPTSANGKPGAEGTSGGTSSGGNSFPVTTVPSDFETRNAGTSLEVEPTLGEDDATVDVTVAPEIVTLLGMDTYGDPSKGIVQPRFMTRKLSTSISLKDGTTAFIGTVNPPHLSGVEGTTADKVAWLSFLRVEVEPVK